MTGAKGLTLVEVIVAMALLAILGGALVGVLPTLSRNTQASSVDTVQSQQVLSLFERIGSAWTNQAAWGNERVDGVDLDDFVFGVTGDACTVAVTTPTPERKRVVITCDERAGLPERSLRAEFGDPGE